MDAVTELPRQQGRPESSLNDPSYRQGAVALIHLNPDKHVNRRWEADDRPWLIQRYFMSLLQV